MTPIRGDVPTPAMLACGLVAGPVYVTVALAQALTRDGFDLARHRFTTLTAGDLGWVQRSNMLLVGLLTVLFAVGAARVLRTGRGAGWAPWLLGLFGAAYAVGGALTADPVAGFPPEVAAEAVRTTWQGAAQNASRGASTLLLVATSVVVARHVAATGRRGWAWFHALYGAAVPVVFAGLVALGSAVGGYPYALAVVFLVVPWTWVTVLAAQLYGLEAGRRAHAGGPAAARS